MNCNGFFNQIKLMIFILSDELDNSSLCCIAAANTNAGDAGVTTVTVCILGGDFVKNLLCDFFTSDEGKSLTVGSEILSLTKGNHLLSHGSYLLSAGDSGLHTAICEKVSDLLAEHCHTLSSSSAELSSSGHNCISSFLRTLLVVVTGKAETHHGELMLNLFKGLAAQVTDFNHLFLSLVYQIFNSIDVSTL